jgi:hypothetical protein
MHRTRNRTDHRTFEEWASSFVERPFRARDGSINEQRSIDRERCLEAGRAGFRRRRLADRLGDTDSVDLRFNAVLGVQLSRVSAEEQQQRWSSRVWSGLSRIAIGVTGQPGASDLTRLPTSASRDGSSRRITGNGLDADLVKAAAISSHRSRTAVGERRRVHLLEITCTAVGRVLIAVTTSIAALCASAGISHAGLDDELSLVDGQGRTITIQQWGTSLNGVSPLDRNRLTREWFHSGRAVYAVTGEGSDDFEGVLELGYEVTFGWSQSVGINFNYTAPNIIGGSEDGTIGFLTPPFFPGASISVDLGNGPGIQEVSTVSVHVSGADGAVAVSNAHGTVTGAAGGVLLRPYARLISSAGDIVSTAGQPWDMN